MSARRARGPAAADASARIGDVLAGFMKSSGLAILVRHPEVHETWQKIVGPEIAEHTRVLGLRAGALEIGVASSALMSDMQFHRAAILQDLQAAVKRPFIARINFVLKAAEPEDDREQERG